jgi:hypothetical protein
MFDTLTHITLVTGHTAVTARREVRDEVLMRLQPIIDAEAGPVPEAGVYLDFIRPLDPKTHRPRDGAAAWSILGGLKPPAPLLAQCVVCWKDSISEECWGMIESMQEVSGLPASPRTKRPGKVPWLAVVLGAGIVSAPKNTIALLGDLERCVAWTLIETPC